MRADCREREKMGWRGSPPTIRMQFQRFRTRKVDGFPRQCQPRHIARCRPGVGRDGVGRDGVDRILEPEMSDVERKGLQRSADAIKTALSHLGLGKPHRKTA